MHQSYAEECPYLQQLYILKYLGVTKHKVSSFFSKGSGKKLSVLFFNISVSLKSFYKKKEDIAKIWGGGEEEVDKLSYTVLLP